MQHGFKIIDCPEVLPADQPAFRWRRVFPYDFTIETHPNCPIDGTPLETIAALVSLTLPEQIRIGACARCGLVGYIDRPSQADIDRYYAETWMGESAEEARVKAHAVAVRQSDLEVFNSLDVDRSLPVLEIGCGYGGTLRALRMAGFTTIDATEHCPARAAAVRHAWGEGGPVNVFTEIPNKRYGLIVSHHVLEHCVDPAALIRACAERQQDGDYMIHSMPDFQTEPSMGILFFLPHLWSFSACSAQLMVNLSGYKPRRLGPDKQLYFFAEKKCGYKPDDRPAALNGILAKDRTGKLLHGLGLVRDKSVLSWQRDSDGTAWKSLPYVNQAASNNFPRSIMVEPLTSFKTDAPIEVAFDGRVCMYIK